MTKHAAARQRRGLLRSESKRGFAVPISRYSTFFLEEVEISALAAIHVSYPMHAACSENRFRSEAYPLAALLGDASLTFEAGNAGELFFRVTLTDRDGKVRTHSVFAPNRVHVDCIGATHVSPTGWLRIGGDGVGERLETDYESLFEAAVQEVISHEWGDEEPYFDELRTDGFRLGKRRSPCGKRCTRISISRCPNTFRRSAVANQGILPCSRARSFRRSDMPIQRRRCG